MFVQIEVVNTKVGSQKRDKDKFEGFLIKVLYLNIQCQEEPNKNGVA